MSSSIKSPLHKDIQLSIIYTILNIVLSTSIKYEIILHVFQLKVLRLVDVSGSSLFECFTPLDVTAFASDGTSTHWSWL